MIVARNEAEHLPSLLADVALAAAQLHECLVVDGESRDGSDRLARLAGARLLRVSAGRGAQLSAGVAATSGAWLLLLHGDARLPRDWPVLVSRAIGQGLRRAWVFRLAIAGGRLDLGLVAWLANLRSRVQQLPYGDQGLLISRERLLAAGGIRPIPLMEDLDLMLRLRRQGRIGMLAAPLRVSARRWSRLGVLGTAWSNARLRWQWRRGMAPERLAAAYYNLAQPRDAADG